MSYDIDGFLEEAYELRTHLEDEEYENRLADTRRQDEEEEQIAQDVMDCDDCGPEGECDAHDATWERHEARWRR
jgi:hypothetical protein